MKPKIKILKYGFLPLLAILVFASTQLTASAARMQISRQLCSLAVFPFNIGGVAATNNDINKLADAICKNHLTIPTVTPFQAKSYTPQPVQNTPDIPVKPGSENKHGPTTSHIHDYFNDSLEDNFYYESFVAKFTIDFPQDAGKDIANNIATVTCETPYPNPAPAGTPTKAQVLAALGDCDGQIAGLWGGTKVKKTATGVEWEFGMDGQGGRPRIFGKNPTLDPLIGDGFDSSNENFRKFGANVNLTTKDVNSPNNAWSATTTSRVLLRDFAIKKTNNLVKLNSFCSVAGDYDSGWCPLAPLPGRQIENSSGKPYYWFEIGAVSTIWKKAGAPPTCQSLQIANAGDEIAMNQLPFTFNVQSTPATGLKYKWSVAPAIGTFDGQQTGYIDVDTSTVYANPNPVNGQIITVIAVDANNPNVEFANCKDTVKIMASPQAFCKSLSPIVVTPANALKPNTPMTLSTQPTFDPAGQAVPLRLRWKAELAVNNQTTNPGNFKDETANDSNQPSSGFLDDLNDFKAFYTGAPANTVITVQAVDPNQNNQDIPQCKQTITIPAIPPPVCQNLTIYRGNAAFPEVITQNDPNNPTNDLYVVVQKDQGVELQYVWEATNVSTAQLAGQFNSVNGTGNPLTNLLANDLTDYTGGATNAQTLVTVKAYDKNNPNTSALCEDQFVINPPDQQLQCDDATFKFTDINGNPVTLTENQPITLVASGKRTNGEDVATMNWSVTNGLLIPQGVCTQLFVSGQTLSNYPALCPVLFTGGQAGSVVSVSAVPVESGNICKRQATVPQNPEKPYCEKITLVPADIVPNGTTSLSATVTYSDGNSYDTEVTWTGNNGIFNNNASTAVKVQSSANPFTQQFTTSQAEAGLHVKVTDIMNPNVQNSAQCQTGVEISTPSPKCEYLELEEKSDGEICVNIGGIYQGIFIWTIGSETEESYAECKVIPPNTSVEVIAKDEPQCQDKFTTKKQPPKFTKAVRPAGSTKSYKKVVSVSSEQDEVEYQLVFEPGQPYTTAVIIDDISDGRIEGETNPVKVGAGYIDYVEGSMTVSIPKCDSEKADSEKKNCYEGDIGNGGITLHQVDKAVEIIYRGEIKNTAITPDNCKDGKVCQEKYLNVAEVEYTIYDEEYHEIDTGHLEDDALVQIFCQYILSRAAGDIFLETDLNAGIDIKMCSKYTSTTGLIIKPGTPSIGKIPSTGPGSIFTLTHGICEAGKAGSLEDPLKPFYDPKTVSENLSSEICEVRLNTGSAFQQKTIANSIEENKTRVSRWEATVENQDAEINALVNQYPDLQVYHIKKGDLVIGEQGFTLADGKGAKTFIIEDGDLMIKGNINYQTLPNVNVRDTASLAFIVLNGSTYVQPQVETLSGVFYIQEGNVQKAAEYRAHSGRLYSGTKTVTNIEPKERSVKKLTVYGSIYGDIEPLFIQRSFAGDPSDDDAGLLIRYDQRVAVNPPQVVKDIMSIDFTETETARP